MRLRVKGQFALVLAERGGLRGGGDLRAADPEVHPAVVGVVRAVVDRAVVLDVPREPGAVVDGPGPAVPRGLPRRRAGEQGQSGRQQQRTCGEGESVAHGAVSPLRMVLTLSVSARRKAGSIPDTRPQKTSHWTWGTARGTPRPVGAADVSAPSSPRICSMRWRTSGSLGLEVLLEDRHDRGPHADQFLLGGFAVVVALGPELRDQLRDLLLDLVGAAGHGAGPARRVGRRAP